MQIRVARLIFLGFFLSAPAQSFVFGQQAIDAAKAMDDRIPATQTNPGWAVSSPTTTISAISIVIWALFLLFCCYFPNLVERKNQPS